MSSGFIPPSLQRLWSTWNIQGFMILSLSMQLVLAAAAPFRKRTSNPFTTFMVWSAYFLADWVAIFAFGLITNSGCQSSSGKSEVDNDVLALWAAFLMMHLGGPDTITAFSLEDNALWSRHLVSLVAQIFAFFYIYARTLPGKNNLLVPTLLIFMAGVIKYGERTRALYLASLEKMKKSIENSPNPKLNDVHSREKDASWKSAFQFFQLLKGFVVDVMPSHSGWEESRKIFQELKATAAFDRVTKEFGFLYDVLYTKTLALNSWWGVLVRTIAYNNLVIALILFCLSEKQELQEVDVRITYLLLTGALVVEMVSGIMLSVSRWNKANGNNFLYVGFQFWVQGLTPAVALCVYGCCIEAVCSLDHLTARLWSETMGAFNLLRYCFTECNNRKGHKWIDLLGSITEKMGIAEVIAEIRYVSNEAFDTELWSFVFQKLQQNALFASDIDKTKKVYESRGNFTLIKHNCNDLVHFIKDFEFDSALLMWHIATEICFCLDDVDNNRRSNPNNNNNRRSNPKKKKENNNRRFSMIMSNYMLYLLVKQPKMMSPIVGVGHVRYRDTCIEVKRIGRRFGAESMKAFCNKILKENKDNIEPANEPGARDKSVLLDSCNLARKLMTKDKKKWRIISEVWVELLLYAAGRCRIDSHARLLCEGGEFISFVWLAMAHLGIGPLIPIE